MKRATLARAGCAALTATALLWAAATAGAQTPYSVPYGKAATQAAAIAELTSPGAPPPGANNWSCRPSSAHPDPIVLVHGATANMTENWTTISPLLANNGYCVFALTYGVPAGTPFPLDQIGGRELMEQSSVELASFISRVLAATHASRVDLVGHSEGTLMPEYYLRFLGGAQYVNRYVAISPLYKGSNVYNLNDLDQFGNTIGLGWLVNSIADLVFPSALEFLSGSSYIAKLNAGSGPAVAGVTYTTLMTKDDNLVVPYTSGMLNAPNATNVVIQNVCAQDSADHSGLAFDPNAPQVMLNALDPAHAQPVRCSAFSPSS